MKSVISVFLLVVMITGSIAQRYNGGQTQSQSGTSQGLPKKNGQNASSSGLNGQYGEQNNLGDVSKYPQTGSVLDCRSSGQNGQNRRNKNGQQHIPTVTPLKYPPPGSKCPNSIFVNDYSEHSQKCTSVNAKGINAPVRQFALDLLTGVVKSKPRQNTILSTFSVWSVLLVILEGAGGETANQIRNTLVLPDDALQIRCNYAKLAMALQESSRSASIEFQSENAFFSDNHLPPKQEFQDILLSPYNVNEIPLNFSDPDLAVKEVNDWVKNSTKGRISKLVQAGDLKTPAFIIANTIYFKAQWKTPFNKSATFLDNFYNEQRENIGTVQMMYQKAEFLYSFVAEIKSHVLDMQYADGKFRMLIILPKVNTKLEDALLAMKKFPVDACYERLVREQEMFSDSVVHVYLPRFKAKTKLILNDYLKQLGIVDVFEADKANLTKITDSVSHLSKIVHVAEIEVNEEGSVASGATGGIFVNRGAPPKFIANRPFAYFIVEESMRSVIFAGKVYNPSVPENT